MSQNQLSRLTGIPQATISAIENDRVRLGVERAKALALAKIAIRRVRLFEHDWASRTAYWIAAAGHLLARMQNLGERPAWSAGFLERVNL